MKGKKYSGLGRRGFIKTVAAAGAGISIARAGRGLADELADRDPVAALITREPGKLKLLALTDLHFFEKKAKLGKDERTLEDARAMIRAFNPEMLLFCGDTWYEDNFGRGFKRCRWACRKLGELGVPWAFVWGNHDTSEDHKKCHKIISGAANSLYRGALYDGNYRIEIISPGQELPFWSFIIVNDAMPESGFQQDQIKWFKAEAGRIKEKYPVPLPAFAFFHVPLTQFRTVGSSAFGVKNEPVMSEKGIPEGFNAIREAGFVKAVFCGHDHVNNYQGALDGIRLQYLRATGWAGYGAEKLPKGGTIITVDASNFEPSFDAVTVFADGKSWELKDKL